MHHFSYQNGVLHGEGVSLAAIADAVGTPFYCYSEATLRRHARVFCEAFAGADMLMAFSVKANSNLAVLKILADQGAGADVVSAGEIERALAAGVAPRKIVFSGVGKTRDELVFALKTGIHQFNVESENELRLLNEIAMAESARAPIAMRVNPDVSAGGHAKISTGKAEDKFGVPWTHARRIYADAAAMDGIAVKGVDIHIGSQIDDLAPFAAAFERVAGLVRDLRGDGIAIERLDLGGGLGIAYGDGSDPPHPKAYADLITRIAAPLDVQLIFEPGRMVAGNAGVLVARTLFVKTGEERRFLILDAGMNDLIRPALYDAHHEVIPVREPAADDAKQRYDVVGPVCETGDRFARDRDLPPIKEGDLVAFLSGDAAGPKPRL